MTPLGVYVDQKSLVFPGLSGHCAKYNSEISCFLKIDASFVQGSVFGPVAYVQCF